MRVLFIATALIAAGLGPALAQPLLCPPVASAAGKPCETFHFHVQLFRPESRDFLELYGTNQFASMASCERARDAQFKRNVSVVEYMRGQRRDWWQADKFGTCHCDMTVEKASPNFLSEEARTQQLRDAEEVRQRVRERLIDAKALPDSEVMRNIAPTLSATPLIGGPKMVSMPAPVAAASSNSPDDLQITKAVDLTPSTVTSLDLPLVDIALPGITPPAEVVAATPTPAPSSTTPSEPPQPAPAPAPQPVVQVAAEPLPVIADEPDLPAPEDVADAFVSYESQRIQNVLKVSSDIGDEAVKAQVLEACTQRIQLLSNLRSIIVGSGAKSRLVAAANGAKKESDRVAVAAKLFGSDITPHWAPKNAADVIFDPGVAEPERVLRDNAASDQQKRHALYALLATSSPTEQQQMWLSSMIEGLLK
ncbi:MAG TPA: hypothetical protein VGQ21_01415 [Thermoanaerobaculia bacterium]|jgi:hypothetical protein|nr:hypothetical protein [Thermoanaerobaculia bacterium]